MQPPTLDQPPFAQRQMPGMTGQQAAPAEDIDSIQEEAATPEEQALRDELMRHAYKVMANKKAFPKLEKMLKADPHNAIADAAVAVIERVEEDKGPQDVDILQSLAEEIIPALADLALAEGVDIPEDELEQVAAVAVSRWSQAHPDRVDVKGMTTIGGAAMESMGMPQGGQEQAPPQGAQPQPQQPAPQQAMPQQPMPQQQGAPNVQTR